MLKELYVNDFAIIDEVRVEFAPGFCSFTGETGAGKSIIIGALELALGGRSSEDMIRSSRENAVVEALFDTRGAPGLPAWLEENGFGGAGEMLVRRVLSRGGKNRAFINGCSATVAQVKAAGAMLVDILGQHDSQTLLDSSIHLMILDRFLGLEPLKGQYQAARGAWLEAKAKLDTAKNGQMERERRIDILRHQVTEIQQAELKPGEYETLTAEKNRLANAEKLMEGLAAALALVDDSDGAASTNLNKALAFLEKLAALDEALAPARSAVEGALVQVEEAALAIRGYLESVDMDPGRLEEADNRLDLIRKLQRKYGGGIPEILKFGEEAEKELQELMFMRDNMDKLRETSHRLHKEALVLGRRLDAERASGAPSFTTAVVAQLKSLNMEKAMLSADFGPPASKESDLKDTGVKDTSVTDTSVKDTDSGPPKLEPEGIRDMEFIFSANPGEPQKPLARIASGGEISRLMLAIKTVLPGDQPASVMVFDEIDTGMGGATADTLGRKLKELSRGCQVFCVTHLPQVARHADMHIRIGKKVVEGKTHVEAVVLDHETRIEELARMAGGVGDGEAAKAALKWAREALADAKKG
ncbi:MAG: DNA repair protein RecN [Nitrospinota bacterium]|nr:DNA repair protein RecN [Nitrospinota bacterium]